MAAVQSFIRETPTEAEHRGVTYRSTPDHNTVAKGTGIKHVWLDPVPHLLTLEAKTWAELGGVQPISIPGYWHDKVGIDIPINALHGGGYISMSASPTDPAAHIARGLLAHCAPVQRVFAVEYRLSRAAPDTPANLFPAALLDALAGYVYLTTTVDIAPADIVVEGDSAGGNLALALKRYLVENAGMPGLPGAPGAVLLLSPWADMSQSNHRPGTSSYTCVDSDYIGAAAESTSEYARAAFFGRLGEEGARSIRFISPASVDVAGLVRGLATDAPRRGGGRAIARPDSTHDFLLLPFYEPEWTEMLLTGCLDLYSLVLVRPVPPLKLLTDNAVKSSPSLASENVYHIGIKSKCKGNMFD